MASKDENDEDYSDLIAKITNNIQQLNQYVQRLETLTKRADVDSKEEFQSVLSLTNDLSKETNNLMKELVNASNSKRSPSLKIQRERLMNDLISILNRYQYIQRNISYMKKQSIQQIQFQNQQINEQLNENISNQEISNKEQLQLQQEHYLKEIKERNEMMKQLDSEIGDITKIMKDLARIVHDQGETVDSIEANVEHTAMYIQQGSADLQRAVVYQQKAMQKKLIIFIFLILLLLIISLILYFFSK
ncbi:unnamed protein product [Dracunculus medinensis]|uniref:t-SNARE coiled-coil homology domain-containing protein n=1 Tax=Dracunculus medinensis TaxID=318479 RepID=A0A0N4U5P3_DRAME|nr:unnamed protein product [Dracunculus medinensis]